MVPNFVAGTLLRRLRKMGLPKFPDLVIICTFSICFILTYLLLNVVQVRLVSLIGRLCALSRFHRPLEERDTVPDYSDY